jgi:hypothetical protein
VSRDWDESEHPRDRRGRFRDKTGGWVEALSDAIGGHPHPVAEGDDLVGTDVDWDGLAGIVRSQSGENFEEYAPDLALDQIYEMQGYHGRPQVMSREQIDDLVARGWTEVWRGVAGRGTSFDQAVERAADFRSGPRHRAGRGIFGNGSYGGDLRVARDYAKFDPVRMRRRRRIGEPLDFDEEDRLFEDPHSGAWGGLLRIALPPDARVIDLDDAKGFYFDEVAQDLSEAQAAIIRIRVEGGPGPTARGLRAQVLADLGRASALRGYDAIRVPGSDGVYYVILNRSILAVQEG